jgi:hypothetical protein
MGAAAGGGEEEEVLEEEEEESSSHRRRGRRHLSWSWAPEMAGRGGSQQVTYGGPGAALVACPYAAGPAGAAAGGGLVPGGAAGGGIPGLGAAGAAFGGVGVGATGGAPFGGLRPPGPAVPLEQQLPNLPLVNQGPVASLLPAYSPAPEAPWVQGVIQPAPIGGGAVIPSTLRPFPQTG